MTATTSSDRQRLLFFGDSITDTYRTDDPEGLGSGFVRIISKRLPAADVVNRGIAGNRIGDLQERLAPDCLELEPDVVTILVGVNDAIRRFNAADDPTPADVYAARFAELLSRLVTTLPDARLVLMTPFVLPVDEVTTRSVPDIEEKAEAIRKLARDHGTALVDLESLFAAQRRNGVRSETIAADGIHPSDEGHGMIAGAWLEAWRQGEIVPVDIPSLAGGPHSLPDEPLTGRLDIPQEPRTDEDRGAEDRSVIVCSTSSAGGRPNERVFRIPALAALDPRTLLAVYDARPTLVDLPSPIDLVCSFSGDGGTTWGPTCVIRSAATGRGAMGFGDPCIIRDGSLLHVLHATSDRAGFFASTGGEDDADGDVLGTASSTAAVHELLEAARTGSEPQWEHRSHTGSIRRSANELLQRSAATSRVTGLFVASGHGIRVERGPHDGRLLAGAVLLVDGEIRVGVLASDDRGESWRTTWIMPPGGDESACAQLSDGRIVLQARSIGHRLQSFSTDGGDSFGPWEPVPGLVDPGCNGDLLAITSPEGPDLLVASHCADPEIRRNVSLTISEDAGRTWTRRLVLDEGSSAYSALADLGDGEIGVLWESDGFRSMRFRRVAITDIVHETGRQPLPVPGSVRIELYLRHTAMAPAPQSRDRLVEVGHPDTPPANAGMIGMSETTRALFARENLHSSFGPVRSRLEPGDTVVLDLRMHTSAPGDLTILAGSETALRQRVGAGRQTLIVPIRLTPEMLDDQEGLIRISARVDGLS